MYIFIYISKCCFIVQTLSTTFILNRLDLLLPEISILKIPTISVSLLVSLSSSEFFLFILIHVVWFGDYIFYDFYVSEAIPSFLNDFHLQFFFKSDAFRFLFIITSLAFYCC